MDTATTASSPLLLLAATALIGAALVALAVTLWRGRGRSADALAAAEAESRDLKGRIGEMMRVQNELTGRIQSMAEVLGSRQADLARTVTERLDGMSHRLGQNMTETTKNTHETLRKLHERLVVIDEAQRTITGLSSQVVELQHILANKQTRGAFGQGRMEAIVQDGLALGAFEFQATLSNGNRPDCLVKLPNGAAALVVDAKFPLDGYNRIKAAESAEEKKAAEAQFRRDLGKHVTDIRERYFIPGETQDTAFMFVPSESIFAELHERFEDVIQRANRIRVVIVSPSLLLLSIQVIQAVLRDAKLREQTHLIQGEVGMLMQDIGRLSQRVDNLRRHFSQANTDIDEIVTSTGKITKRGTRIEELDLAEPGREGTVVPLGGRAARG